VEAGIEQKRVVERGQRQVPVEGTLGFPPAGAPSGGSALRAAVVAAAAAVAVAVAAGQRLRVQFEFGQSGFVEGSHGRINSAC
jgi:hypothetical protein